jgi:2Fe-2S ferredoxin
VPEVVFTEHDGSIRRIEAPVGTSLMRVAVDNGVEGIEAVCGGVCACATCHVYIDETWFDRLTPPDETEDYMLDETDAERRPNSRLCCQIKLTEPLNGIAVTIPEAA